MRIWKFPLPITDRATVTMPQGARILHVAEGDTFASLWLWAEVDPSAPAEDRTLLVVGTGNPMPEVGSYVGTVLSGPLVWHVYEGQ